MAVAAASSPPILLMLNGDEDIAAKPIFNGDQDIATTGDTEGVQGE